jgi:hypothetical protein
MAFREKEDWKELLSEDAKQILANIFESTKKHKGAYLSAEDVKIAQLWCAIVELKKDTDEIKRMLGKLEEPFKAIVAVGEAEKKRTIERVIAEIIKPTDEATQEATRKLVESLMKF